MADGTKAVVDTSVTDAAALAMALGEVPEEPAARSTDGPASEPATGAADPAPKGGRKTAKPSAPTPATLAAAKGPKGGKRTKAASGAAGTTAPKSATATAAAATATTAAATTAGTGSRATSRTEPAAATPAPAEGTATAPSTPEPAGRAAEAPAKPARAARAAKPADAADAAKPADASDSTASTETTDAGPSKSTRASKSAGSTKSAGSSKAAPAKPATGATAAGAVPEPGEEPAESEEPSESTAPLSAAEIAAELAEGAARRAKAAKSSRAAAPASRPAAKPKPKPATSTETLDADTATLPATLAAPLRHSGDRIADRYRLEECITHTEVFSSWRAVDEKLRRAVGVHLLAAGHRRAKAVLTAARSAALLGDPRFVQVLDAVQEGDLVYVIREWLPDASDLARLLAGGPMEPYEAYQMVRQVTDAVAAAHRRGQAHLRLTPTCVLRTETGQYRINGIAVDAAIRGLSTDDAERTDTKAIGALLYAALTHRWPYPEDRYDLQGMPKGLGCVPPDQVKAGVHKGLSELAARALGEHPPHHQDPITSPEQLAKAIALLPKIRQPEPAAPPAFTPPRYPSSRSAATTGAPSRPLPGSEPNRRPEAPRPVAPPPVRPRRRLLTAAKWTASLVALAAIGLGSWQLVDRMNHHPSHSTGQPAPTPNVPDTSTAPTGARLPIAALTTFNAFGQEKDEHSSELPNAHDDNPATAWTTQGYNDQFAESGYKKGTGILLDLGSAKQVSSVDLTFLGDHKVELKAAPAGATSAPTADEAGYRSFGAAVASGSGSQVQLKPEKAITTRYLLIWLTGIPNDGDRFRGKVAEIKVNG
ncbi:protein kinase family protein [Kitasatospora sp. NPDC048540]|uniref:protein kinase family protein n=1 Tax=Kitasatospora sp. NPDC048540 TaxID=3155634 RepID=UPI0033E9171B